MKSVVGGIVPRHGFDHESFDGPYDSSLIWGRIHFEDARIAMDATRPLAYT